MRIPVYFNHKERLIFNPQPKEKKNKKEIDWDDDDYEDWDDYEYEEEYVNTDDPYSMY